MSSSHSHRHGISFDHPLLVVRAGSSTDSGEAASSEYTTFIENSKRHRPAGRSSQRSDFAYSRTRCLACDERDCTGECTDEQERRPRQPQRHSLDETFATDCTELLQVVDRALSHGDKFFDPSTPPPRSRNAEAPSLWLPSKSAVGYANRAEHDLGLTPTESRTELDLEVGDEHMFSAVVAVSPSVLPSATAV